MSNASTIRRQVAGTQQLTLASLLGTTISTTATPFSLNNNGLTGTGGGIIPLSAGVTGLYAGTGQVINIHVAGTITGGTAGSSTLIIDLYVVPAADLPFASTVVTTANAVTAGALKLTSGTPTGTLGASATAGSFQLDAYVQLDAQFNLAGWYQGQVFGSTTGAKTATTIQLLTGEADLNFIASVTLGGTVTGAVVTLDEFSLALV